MKSRRFAFGFAVTCLMFTVTSVARAGLGPEIAISETGITPGAQGSTVNFSGGFRIPAGASITSTSLSAVGLGGGGVGFFTYTKVNTIGGVDNYSLTGQIPFLPSGTYTATASLTYTDPVSGLPVTISGSSALFTVP